MLIGLSDGCICFQKKEKVDNQSLSGTKCCLLSLKGKIIIFFLDKDTVESDKIIIQNHCNSYDVKTS